MDVSARWLNDYLDRPCTPEEQAVILTAHAFPVEHMHAIAMVGDIQDTTLSVEVTSNRGDCLCHLGLAREIAAASSRGLKPPAPANRATAADCSASIRVVNQETARCPIYTARIIRGVTVKPSPDWLAERLRAIGQIPRNNIVDATNFVLFELGQPTHVFDLAKIKGGAINVRLARARERFLPIGECEKEIELTPDDLVIADASDAVAIGGVKGGAHSAVTIATRDILIESATFSPVTVRTSSRRHRIQSASAYRFERGVQAGFVDGAAERLVQLVLDLAGGELCRGAVSDGAPLPQPRRVVMRVQRCKAVLGIDFPAARMIDFLARLGFQPTVQGDEIACTVPLHRLDIEREIDLIEEVARLNGFDGLPIAESIAIRVAPPQPRLQAKRALAEALSGMGYLETVTHSLVSEQAARRFLRPDQQTLRVADERAGAEPALRPSIVPSLLRVRKLNEDQGVSGLALFEIASTFVNQGGEPLERNRMALLSDVSDPALGLRPLRGALEALAAILAGDGTLLRVAPIEEVAWLEPGTGADISFNGRSLGWMGIVDAGVRAAFEVEAPVAAAEIDLEPLLTAFPPQRDVRHMPSFPPIERDISAILDDSITWERVRTHLDSLRLQLLESIEFVGTYRGKQIGDGKKSQTLRLRFRALDRTLTHDEVDPQVNAAMQAIERDLGGAIRR